MIFGSSTIYFVTIVALIIRILVNFGVCQYLYVTYVWNSRVALSAIGEQKYREEEGNEIENKHQEEQYQKSQREIQHEVNGRWLYSMMHLLFYTGSYRLLPSVHFAPEMMVAYAIELFMGVLPFFFIQMLVGTRTQAEIPQVHNIALIIKFALLVNYLFEVLHMVYEFVNNRKLKKLNIQGYTKLSEEERRK